MNIPPPDVRMQIIAGSIRCFVLGFFSLLPLIGLPLAVLVLVDGWRIGRRWQGAWNPAERYLRWGCHIASCGVIISIVAALCIGVSAGYPFSR